MTAIPWVWRPNWSERVLERLDWRTDVLQAYRGDEQGRALREWPRQSVEFTAVAAGDDRRHLESVLAGDGAAVYQVPLWHDGLDLPVGIDSGASVLPVDPVSRDYRVGTALALLGPTSRDVEVLTISESEYGEIELAGSVTRAWPPGTRVVPVRNARLVGSPTLPRFTGDVATVRVRFEMTEPAQEMADADQLYGDLPLLWHRPDWSNDLDVEVERKLARLDADTGPQAVYDEAALPFGVYRWRWLLGDRDAIVAWRRRAFLLRGRQGRLWVPSWADDLVPAADFDGGTTIDVRWCGYAQRGAVSNRRHLRIELADGDVLYAVVASAADLGGGVERLTLTEALGVELGQAQVVQISFLSYCRQESDGLEFDWFTGDCAQIAMGLRSLPEPEPAE